MKTTLPSTQAWSAVPFHHVLPPCQVPLPSQAPLVLGSQISVVAAWAVPNENIRQAKPRAQPSRTPRVKGLAKEIPSYRFGSGDSPGRDAVIGLIFIVSSARKANSPATVARRGDFTELPGRMPYFGFLSSRYEQKNPGGRRIPSPVA